MGKNRPVEGSLDRTDTRFKSRDIRVFLSGVFDQLGREKFWIDFDPQVVLEDVTDT